MSVHTKLKKTSPVQCRGYFMKSILMILAMLFGVAYGQTVGYLRYDTVKIMKNGGNAELVIQNATRGVTNGVLTNQGNGKTAFVSPSALALKFGVSGQDDASTADRTFDNGQHKFTQSWTSTEDVNQTINITQTYTPAGLSKGTSVYSITASDADPSLGGANSLQIGIGGSTGTGFVLNAGQNTGEHKVLKVRADSAYFSIYNAGAEKVALAITGVGSGNPTLSFPQIENLHSTSTTETIIRNYDGSVWSDYSADHTGVNILSYTSLDNITGIHVDPDKIVFTPYLGDIRIDTLNASHNANDSVVVWDPSDGKLGMRAIPSGGSSSITVGTTTITSGTSTRVPFNDGGVYGEDAGMTYNKTTDALSVAGSINLNGTAILTPTALGVGTISPSASLHINGGEQFTIWNGGNPRILIGDGLGGSPDYGGFKWVSATKSLGAGVSRSSGNLNDLVISGDASTPGYVGIHQTSPTSYLQVGGSFALPYHKVSADAYVITSTDYTLSVDNGLNDWTITLPDATTCANRIYVIKRFDNTSSGLITIGSAGGSVQDPTDGSFNSTYDVVTWGSSFAFAKYQSNGTNWEAIK